MSGTEHTLPSFLHCAKVFLMPSMVGFCFFDWNVKTKAVGELCRGKKTSLIQELQIGESLAGGTGTALREGELKV